MNTLLQERPAAHLKILSMIVKVLNLGRRMTTTIFSDSTKKWQAVINIKLRVRLGSQSTLSSRKMT